MMLENKLNNAFAIRSFLSLFLGVALFMTGKAMGAESPPHTPNWYYVALCVIFALYPVAILRRILHTPHFSRRLYSLTLCTGALLAIALGLALSLGLI